MPTFGEEKRRDMSRSVLPSTRRKGARADKRHQHHMVRSRVRDLIAKGDWDNEADLVLDAQRHKPYQGIKVVVRERRDGDNIGPIMRWAEANADKMGDTPQERYAKMRSMLPPNIIGWHAMTHIDNIEAYDIEPRAGYWRSGETPAERRERMEKRRVARFLSHYEALYLAITTPGGHKAFNRFMREGWVTVHKDYSWLNRDKEPYRCPRCDGGARTLHGIHDIIPFLEEMFQGRRTEDGGLPARMHGNGWENAIAYCKDMGWMDKEWLGDY